MDKKLKLEIEQGEGSLILTPTLEYQNIPGPITIVNNRGETLSVPAYIRNIEIAGEKEEFIHIRVQREVLPGTGQYTGEQFCQDQYGTRYDVTISGDKVLEEIQTLVPGVKQVVMRFCTVSETTAFEEADGAKAIQTLTILIGKNETDFRSIDIIDGPEGFKNLLSPIQWLMDNVYKKIMNSKDPQTQQIATEISRFCTVALHATKELRDRTYKDRSDWIKPDKKYTDQLMQ